MPTPSYYALAFRSVLMVMIGLLIAERPGRIHQVFGWILVAVGGWCCFMAKPTTAAAIALVVMLHVVVLHRKSLLAMVAAALLTLALLMVTAYLIDGGAAGLLTRMVKSAEMESMLGAGHELSRMFRINWPVTNRSQVAIAMLVAIAFLLDVFVGSTHKLLTSLAIAAGLIATIAIALLGTDSISIKSSTLFLVSAFTCVGAMFYRGGIVLRTQTSTSIALALTFWSCPASARTRLHHQLLGGWFEGLLVLDARGC